ncbi:uncharacterized protein [Eurosta solidaginis]|uniref:uncharacterized protein n=1 Tax=Eurosta solidaginis TaxID=178769 RepID=UPI00353116CE
MSAGEIKESRKRWTREETLHLLQCYSARKDEFKQTTVTIKALKAKMRTLLIAYKNAKDNNRQTGAEYCKAPFMEEMNEIFGPEPIISNSHSLNLGSRIQRPLPECCSLAAVGKTHHRTQSLSAI